MPHARTYVPTYVVNITVRINGKMNVIQRYMLEHLAHLVRDWR
jgi:hypothetical protein